MMSDNGAVKKTVDSTSFSRTHRSHAVRTKTLSQSVDDYDERADKREKRREPQIIDSRALGDRRSKTGNSLSSKIVLPDKNPLKIRESRHNGLSTAKSSFDGFASVSSVARKQVPSKTKSESNVRSSVIDRTNRDGKIHKVQAHYSEKRGESSLYIPESSTSKLNSMMKASESRRSREKPSLPISPEKQLPRPSSRERRKSRTLSPSEVKVLHSTINKVNPKAFIGKNPGNSLTKMRIHNGGKYKYDDDSEDYESNFEDTAPISETSDSSILSIDLEPIIPRTEEKKRTIDSAKIVRAEKDNMLDSGHYELTEARKRAAMVGSLMSSRIKTPPPLPELEQPVNQSYREEKQSENKSLPSSTDEGFEDARSGDFFKPPPASQVTLNNIKTYGQNKKVKKRFKPLTRGQILMSMVKLDTLEWSLYESKPISYEEFIRTYGKLNAQQVSTQTNEDNLHVEVQTEINELENKWTQYPVRCRSNLDTVEDVKLFKSELIGVGRDRPDGISLINPLYDLLQLNEFLSRAGKLVLALLEEKESGGNIIQNETHEFPFSEGFIKLSVSSISFLCGRQITMLCYSENHSKILISIHASVNEKIESMSKQEYIIDCCIGCVWNVNEPSKPIKLLYSQSPITACCFHCTNNNIIFAGLQDGSICLWDLREEETWHQKIIDKIHEMDWVIRSPTYTTAGNWEVQSHMAPVVSVQIVSKMEQDEIESFSDKIVSIQICSLDDEGHLIIWSVLRNLSNNLDDLGLTQWGKVKLLKSQEVPLFIMKNESSDLKRTFIDMNVDNVDSNTLYLATNDTNIFYANCIGAKNNIPCYKINEIDSCGSTTCIEVCPFKQSYFFAGCNDGSIRLHSSNIETPLLKLKDEDSGAGIRNIQWSKSKPLTIYVLDDHSRIVVWDLSNSDIHPTHTIATKAWGHVKCMRLSPCNSNRDMLNQYLALGTDTGNVEVHKLKQDFYYSDQNDVSREIDTFLRYVSIL